MKTLYFVVKLEGNFIVVISHGGNEHGIDPTHTIYEEMITQGFDVYGCYEDKIDAHNYADYRNRHITDEEYRKLTENETEEAYD